MSALKFVFLPCLLIAASAAAQGTVWNGSTITFSNAPGSDWTQPANADHLTDSVWLTRATSQGLFNYFEGGFTSGLSPSGTEWALGNLANYASLSYTDWTTCFGGRGNLATTIISTNAVLHLISEDIYLSVKFTYWGGSGGGFAYTRSTPAAVPEPSAAMLLLAGLAGMSVWRRK